MCIRDRYQRRFRGPTTTAMANFRDKVHHFYGQRSSSPEGPWSRFSGPVGSSISRSPERTVATGGLASLERQLANLRDTSPTRHRNYTPPSGARYTDTPPANSSSGELEPSTQAMAAELSRMSPQEACLLYTSPSPRDS
eukprot:TRINITY_DN16651_c0_g1_i3.p1 TRINITY_DN16651_c0_g1~~TRINITY_DN16651_c0_g1_i3.p1  ORF type:complete len:139 (-),score=24.92 TRINITY_DN16651_c0_g1_i3:115-531(-)